VTIRVLVVDDSRFVRSAIARMLAAVHDVSIVGFARDGREALEKTIELAPDVVTLDLQLPGLDGIDVLRRIMQERPTPVVVVSSFAGPGTARTLEALAAGAVDYVDKSRASPMRLYDLGEEIARKVKLAARCRPSGPPPPPSLTDTEAVNRARIVLARAVRPKLVVIGASTGGPHALQEVLWQLPAEFGVPIVVVQHMPDTFVPALAAHLNAFGRLPVTAAAHGDRLEAGHILVAPARKALAFRREAAGLVLSCEGEPSPGALAMPLDWVAARAADVFGAATCLVVLTGMGSDGLRGAREVRAAGGVVLAESETTCVVYGMPREVAQAGLATAVIPLDAMAPMLAGLAASS
jgi:two-component system, chemotaxis family, protein-glutamate methylesterase/glutaminase